MSGFDEGAVYCSDQAPFPNGDDGRGRDNFFYKFQSFIKRIVSDENINPKHLIVRMEDLNNLYPDCHEKLRDSPSYYLPLFETAAAEVFVERGRVEESVHISLTSMEDPLPMRSLGAQCMSKLVKVAGCIKTAFAPLLHENSKYLKAVPQPEEDLGPTDPCEVVPDRSKNVQHTLILQENPEDVPTGELCRDLILYVDAHHLVQRMVPGTRLTIMGIYTADSDYPGRGVAVRQPHIRVVGMEINEADSRGSAVFTDAEVEEFKKFASEPDAYKNICSKIAPSIFGHDDVKKAVACLLFGGSRKEFPDGVILRGDIHILLVGGPSTAKSQFLKFVEKTAPVAVYTSGKGSTAAGLTASVIRDSGSGGFGVEGGAMLLASGGVVCIDDIDQLQRKYRASIVESMERQTISIAKAGMSTVLDSRVSVLAAATPPSGRYDNLKSAQDIDLHTTFLSRFDLILTSEDVRVYGQDKDRAGHIIKVHASAHHTMSGDAKVSREEKWLKRYIQYCRTKCSPRLSDPASLILQNHYLQIRQDMKQPANEAGMEAPIHICSRHLEVMIRLSEALAKMSLSSVATEENALEAIRLFAVSTKAVARSGLNHHINLTPVMANEIKEAEAAIRNKMGIGCELSEEQLIDGLAGRGTDESIVRRALLIMANRGEVEYRRGGRVIRRQ